MPDVFEHFRRVEDREIDALGRASNIAYLEWMLDAAVAHSAAQGWPAEAYVARGAGWVVRAHAIEYRKPAFPGDRLVVLTWVTAMTAATSVRRYRIVRRSDGALLASAETTWAFIDLVSGRPTRVPREIADAFPVVATPPELPGAGGPGGDAR